MDEFVTVFIVVADPQTRQGLRAMLEAGGLLVVGDAGTARAGLPEVFEMHPQVLLLDIQLPDCSGAEFCCQVLSRLPSMACLLLTSFADSDAHAAAVRAGAAGLVVRKIRGMRLVESIRQAANVTSLRSESYIA